MKLSRYYRRVLIEHYEKEAAQLNQNRSWINKQPKDSPMVAWKGHRRHVALVGALRRVLGIKS